MITGVIKVLDTPQDFCITDMTALVKALEKYLAVEFETDQITNVVVSASEPDTTDRAVIWFRINNAGNFIGLHVFVQGQWVQSFPPPQCIFRMYGDSRNVPIGYALIEVGLSGFTASMVADIQSTWKPVPGEDYWSIFDVVYVGV